MTSAKVAPNSNVFGFLHDANHSKHTFVVNRENRQNFQYYCASFCCYLVMETGDRLGSSWFRISSDRFENTVSLGHIYPYPRSPLQVNNLPKISQNCQKPPLLMHDNSSFGFPLIFVISFISFSLLRLKHVYFPNEILECRSYR